MISPSVQITTMISSPGSAFTNASSANPTPTSNAPNAIIRVRGRCCVNELIGSSNSTTRTPFIACSNPYVFVE